ncbi:chemotaxis protein CheD [Thiobacillus sp. 65-1402]|uniref:chemotaxis protein CheD n=1 Tax=Thiobacillus sp. 65-1402 TaxID=1895861 RepID=UPI00095D3B5B|nr:chemotaxis protein CheD [Thiobacillus sp. 65-1402]OJW95060.1 MAG: chemotaxis protein CheD [Thiobacillus sp. 65-1402]
MRKPPHVIEIFLNPGEFYFGDRDVRIRTILGSCVSITLWHPKLLIGGMCHYMLPSRQGRETRLADGKYADEALGLLFEEIRRSGTALEDYEVKLFGGGNMFQRQVDAGQSHIGIKNAEAGRHLLKHHGLRAASEDLGGAGHRTVLFDIWSGHVWVRQFAPKGVEYCNGS